MLEHLAVGKFSSSGSAYPELFVCCIFTFASLLHLASPHFRAVVALYCFPWTKVPIPVTLCWEMMANAELRSVFFPSRFLTYYFSIPHLFLSKAFVMATCPSPEEGWKHIPLRSSLAPNPAACRLERDAEHSPSLGPECSVCPAGTDPPGTALMGIFLCWDQPVGPFSMTGWIYWCGGERQQRSRKDTF